MSEKRVGLGTESQIVVRLTAGAILDEALGGHEDPVYQASPDYPNKLYLRSLKGFSMPRNPDRYQVDEFVRLRDGVSGLSALGLRAFQLTDYVKDIREDGMNGRLVAVRVGLDLSDEDVRETLLAPPLFGPSRGDNVITANRARDILQLAQGLGRLPLEYRIEHPAPGIEDAFDRFKAVVKAGATVTELLLVPDNPEALGKDYFPERKGPTRTEDILDRLFIDQSDLPPREPIDLATARGEDGSVKSAS
jgi:hypothetical protein